jgi:hypothetical protein
MLLEVALIQTPKIKVFSSYEPTKFFYMPPGPPSLPQHSPPEAYAGGTPTDGRFVGIGVHRFLNPMPGLNGGIAKPHPTVLENIQRQWAACVNPPLPVFSDPGPKKNAALSPLHRLALLGLPAGNDETNIEWFEESGPTNHRLRKCSSHEIGKAIHVAGDHIGLRQIVKFPVEESALPPLGRRRSVFPWLPPFG